ncbi:MAG: histidine--tRNA ligase, partial [Nanoarchaeota archaeon]|nr:histidine--tRNA ligase [Nanoarchaeota archaeon]
MLTKQIRLTKELVAQLQALVDSGIYPNLSEAVRDAVRRMVTGTTSKVMPIESKERKAIEKAASEIKKQFQNPTGTTDFYPEEEAIKLNIFNRLRKTAENFGFKEVDVPIIETLDLLKAKQGQEITSQIFTIEKKSDEELAIRAEFTPSLARMFVAKQKALAKPVKWFCINKVLRYERPQKGRLREFFQFNCEIYGSAKPEADAECINLITASLKSLGLTDSDFVIKLNNRKLMQGLLEELIGKEKINDFLSLLDKRAKITEAEFSQRLGELGITIDLDKFLNSTLDNLETQNETAKQGIEELKGILSLVDKNIVKFDIETVRGLAYYTGTVFEVYDKEEKYRSIAGGGRYDQMIELFKGEPTAATGFGLGYATLSLLLEDRNLVPVPDTSPDYFIAIVNNEV